MQPTFNGAIAPYRDASANHLYELLFCDKPGLFATTDGSKLYPWNILRSDEADLTALQQIVEDESLETRCKILALGLMRSAGIAPAQQELLGVIIEVGLDQGLDVVAAYKDGTARYMNATGKVIVWDAATPASTRIINDLFAHSETVVQRIGKWDGERRSHPKQGDVRLSFLVSDGLYFGEGPQAALFNDAMAKPVLMAAMQLMSFLVEKVLVEAV